MIRKKETKEPMDFSNYADYATRKSGLYEYKADWKIYRVKIPTKTKN